jgi:hypothetical protein
LIRSTMNRTNRDIFFGAKWDPLRVSWKIFKYLLFINISFPKFLIVNIILWFVFHCPILSFDLLFLCFFTVRIFRRLVYMFAFKLFLLVLIINELWDINFKTHFFQSVVKRGCFFNHIIEDSLVLKTFLENPTHSSQCKILGLFLAWTAS